MGKTQTIMGGVSGYSPHFIAKECQIVAEVIVEVAPPTMCAVGIYALNPEFCGPFWWLTTNPAYKKALKLATEKGCDFLVEAGATYYKVVVYDMKDGVHSLKHTHHSLNTYPGMEWLRRYLSGYY